MDLVILYLKPSLRTTILSFLNELQTLCSISNSSVKKVVYA